MFVEEIHIRECTAPNPPHPIIRIIRTAPPPLLQLFFVPESTECYRDVNLILCPPIKKKEMGGRGGGGMVDFMVY